VKITDEQIIDLAKSQKGVTAVQLTKLFDINPSTARSRLNSMAKSGILIPKKDDVNGLYGYNYMSEISEHDDVFKTSPRIQNFRLIVKNLDKKIEPYYKEYNIPDEEHKFWTIRVNISKRNNLTISFSGASGFDLSAMFMYSKHYIDQINELFDLHITYSDVNICTMETFTDFYKLGISNCSSLYLSDLSGYMEKIYSKDYGVRVEKRIATRLPFEFLFSAMSNPDIKKYLFVTHQNTKKIEELQRLVSIGLKQINQRINDLKNESLKKYE
jgi:hypothetical protein